MRHTYADSIRELILAELLNNRLARDDDRELLYAILVQCGFDYPKEDFLKLPNLGYITRIKRHIQLQDPRLRGRKKRSDAWKQAPSRPRTDEVLTAKEYVISDTETIAPTTTIPAEIAQNPATTVLSRISRWMSR